MSRAAWLACLLLPGVVVAAPADDYLAQWPLSLPQDEAGVYRVMLDASVYGAARSPRLADVDVLNAAGQAVPVQVFAPDAAPRQPPARVPVRWFELPARAGAGANDIALWVERSTDGRVQRIGTRVAATPAANGARAAAWLVDASGIEGGIAALWLDWAPATGSVDAAYRVEGSDDLRDWRVLQPRVAVVDLVRDGQRLRQPRVPVDGAARYLRLVPLSGAQALVLTGVEAERVAEAVRALPTQWRALAGDALREAGATGFTYELDGRFPVESVDVQLPGNGTGEWTLYSRDDADAAWTWRAGPWVAYRIGEGQRSAPQPLAQPVRDRHWKLVGRGATSEPTVLRLGWRPETLVFVAQGAPPYRLVAGSARASRGDAPVAQSLEAIRGTRGRDWQPPLAGLGTRQPLAGERALSPTPRDWRGWLLWGLLVAGALTVAGFAISLLRQPRS